MNDLRLPLLVSIMGTIVEIKALEGAEYESLKRDTTVLTLVDLNDQIHTVWISRDQITEYGLDSKLFVGNIVTVQLAQNVAEETYYLDADGDKQPHEATFDSFTSMVNTPAISLHMKAVPQFIIDGIERERATVAKASTVPAPRFHASRAKVLDEDAAKARIDVLLDKFNKTSNPMIKQNIQSMMVDLGWKGPVEELEGTVTTKKGK